MAAGIRQPDSGQLRREFTLSSSLSFAFAFISPIVALYAIFELALGAAGPSFWWAFPIVFAGQLLVAAVFAVLVSRWPLEGSVYQWSTRLFGHGYGWFTGWFYTWTLVIAMATVAVGTAGFLANIFGLQAPGSSALAFIAFLVLLFGTGINLVGRKVLKVFMMCSLIANVVGSVGLAVWLLVAHREQDLSIMFDFGESLGMREAFFGLNGVFLLAVVFIGFSFVGFESAGAIAEEVKEPERVLPKAVLFSLTCVAVVVMFASLAVILATPENAEQLEGYETDPVYAVLTAQLGAGLAMPLQALFALAFLTSFLALQTSASRLIWSKARDGALPGARVLVVLTSRQRQPIGAVLVTTVIGSALLLLSTVAEDFYTVLVNFTSGGFYLSFLLPTFAFTVVVARGRWKGGAFSLGAWTRPIAFVATAWLMLQGINIAWPRALNENVWLDWAVVLGALGLTVLGAIIYGSVRSRVMLSGPPKDFGQAVAEDGDAGAAEGHWEGLDERGETRQARREDYR